MRPRWIATVAIVVAVAACRSELAPYFDGDVTPPPRAPSTISAVPGYGAVRVIWESTGAASYTVTLSTGGASTRTFVSTSSSLLVSSVRGGVPHTFAIVVGTALSPAVAVIPLSRGAGSLVPRTVSTSLSGGPAGGFFGHSLAIADLDGDGLGEIAVGAPGVDSPSANAGWVGIYSSSNLSTPIVTPGTTMNASFGFLVRSAGDLNDDGREDLIVGSEGNAGRVTVFFGTSGGGIAQTQIINGSTAGAFFGRWAAIGDIDGDADDDLAIGAPVEPPGGRVFGYVQNSDDTFQSDFFSPTPDATANFGQFLEFVGDVNGDGIDDLAIGAPTFDLGSVPDNDDGAMFVLLGEPAPEPANGEGAVPIGGYIADSSARWGHAIAPAGDLNLDGYADFVAGAPGIGEVRVCMGMDSANLIAPVTLASPGGTSFFGATLATADLNGDELLDLLIGEEFADVGGNNSGRTTLWLGLGTAPWFGPTSWAVSGPTADGQFGHAFATGDVDGDGVDDFVISASQNATMPRVFLYYGAPAEGPTAWAGAAMTGTAGTAITPLGALATGPRGGGPLTCTWLWGDAGSDDVANCAGLAPPFHTYDVAGDFVLTLEVTNSLNVTSRSSTTVSIRE